MEHGGLERRRQPLRGGKGLVFPLCSENRIRRRNLFASEFHMSNWPARDLLALPVATSVFQPYHFEASGRIPRTFSLRGG